MGVGPSASEQVFSQRKKDFFKLFQDKSLTPKLLQYVRLTNQNVCRSSLIRQISEFNNDDFVWFHPTTSFELEDIEDIKNDGYELIFPKEPTIVEGKSVFTGGILLGKTSFKAKFLQCYKTIQNGVVQFFYFDFSIVRQGSHATSLIYNGKTKQFEWYDSNGAYSYVIPISELDPTEEDKEAIFLFDDYNKIKGAFNQYLYSIAIDLLKDGIKDAIDVNKPFVSVEETCPRFGPQSLEGEFSKQFKDEYEVIGYCQVWSVIYLDTRLKNPNKEPFEINEIVLSTPSYLSYQERGAYLRLKVQKFLDKAFNYLKEKGIPF